MKTTLLLSDQPVRVQRKRTKGWRKPDNTVNVCRPGKWGNPFKCVKGQIYVHAGYRRKALDPWVWLQPGTEQDIICLFEEVLKGGGLEYFAEDGGIVSDILYWRRHFKNLDITELRGKNLMCFCPERTEFCHAETLLKIANYLDV
jgi:hypothetical protein